MQSASVPSTLEHNQNLCCWRNKTNIHVSSTIFEENGSLSLLNTYKFRMSENFSNQSFVPKPEAWSVFLNNFWTTVCAAICEIY